MEPKNCYKCFKHTIAVRFVEGELLQCAEILANELLRIEPESEPASSMARRLRSGQAN